MSTTATTTVEARRPERRPSIHSQASAAGSVRSLSIHSRSPLPNTAPEDAGNASYKSHRVKSASKASLGSTLTSAGAGAPLGPATSIQLHELGPSKRHQESSGIKLRRSENDPAPFDMSIGSERLYLGVLCLSLFMAGWNDVLRPFHDVPLFALLTFWVRLLSVRCFLGSRRSTRFVVPSSTMTHTSITILLPGQLCRRLRPLYLPVHSELASSLRTRWGLTMRCDRRASSAGQDVMYI